jgi:hypothetical protein
VRCAPYHPLSALSLICLWGRHEWEVQSARADGGGVCALRRSRLATCIKLTKELDGIQVIVPDTNPDLSNYL